MNYPLISDYIEAVKAAEENFDELSHLRSVLNADGMPVMSVGGFSVVFKMRDERDGKLYAVKCFTKDQDGRAESYKLIADELEFVSSNYLTPIRYLEKELFVDTEQTDETEFPVLLMDWVEGITLDKYLLENSGNKFLLEMLAYQFCKLSSWLLSQSFAHGDIKPDNILVRDNGSIVLVDYDGMYVPAMKGQNAREQGSPGFRHPTRVKEFFDEHIDDFPIALIALALKAYSVSPQLLDEYCNNDTMFFTEKDFAHIHSSKAMNAILELTSNEELCSLYGAFMIALAKGDLSLVSSKLLDLNNPKADVSYGEFIYNQARNLCEKTEDKSKIDYNKAFRLFQKAAKLGNADAQCCMGCCFKKGYGTSINYAKAREWYDIASGNGCARALRHIGICYEEGLGVKKDMKEAITWYLKAAEQGESVSMIIMGEMYYYGEGGIQIDYAQSVIWFTKAAEAGDSGGMLRLGLCYLTGAGVPKDYKVAVQWFQKSAEGLNYDGQWVLGRCYEYGIGIEKDLSSAFNYYQKAAKAGSSDGQWRLGRCYEYGIGTQINLQLAKSYYEQAAKQDHKKALESLKRMETDDLPF